MNIQIDGEYLDLYPDMNIGITLSINDIDNITTRKSYKTPEIKVPATEKNRRLLGFFDDITSIKNYSINAVYKDDVIECSGKVKFYEAVIENNAGYFNIQIITGNGDWSTVFEGKYLHDYDFSTIEHTYNRDNIISSWVDDADYLYPLIDYGRFHGTPIVGSLLNSYVGVHDMLPSVNIKTILNKIFNEQGYKVEGIPENYFLLSKNPNIFDKDDADNALFKVFGYQDEIYSQNITAGAIGDSLDLRLNGIPSGDPLNGETIAFNTTDFDNGSNYVAFDRKYTVSKAGTYVFLTSIRLIFDFPTRLDYSDDIEVTIDLCINDVIVATYNDSISSLGGSKTTNIEVKDKARYLSIGDYINVKASVNNITINNTYSTDIPVSVTVVQSSYFMNETLTRPADGYEWSYEDFLPNLKVLDFLKGIIHAFNFYVLTSTNERKVEFIKYNDFYSSDRYNKSINKLKTITIKRADIASTINVRYLIDEKDNAITNQKILYSLGNGNGSVSEIINPVFATNHVATSLQLSYMLNPYLAIACPLLYNTENIYQTSPYLIPVQSFDFLPRLIFYNGQKVGTIKLDGTNTTDIPDITNGDLKLSDLKTYYDRLIYQKNNGEILQCMIDYASNEVADIINNTGDYTFRKLVLINEVEYILTQMNNYISKKGSMCMLEKYDPISVGVTSEIVNIVDNQQTQNNGTGGGSSGAGSVSELKKIGITTTEDDTETILNIGFEYTWFNIGYCINESTGLNEIYFIISTTNTTVTVKTLVKCKIAWEARKDG